jgi:hypothetical protein
MLTRQTTGKFPASIKRVSFPENLLFDENPKKCRIARSLDFKLESNEQPAHFLSILKRGTGKITNSSHGQFFPLKSFFNMS